jgi:hypothetical protein
MYLDMLVVDQEGGQPAYMTYTSILKLVVCVLLRVLGQVQGFRLTQHWFEYFIQ